MAVSGRIVCFLLMSGLFMFFTSIVGIYIVKMVVVGQDVMSYKKQDQASQKCDYVILSFHRIANIVF